MKSDDRVHRRVDALDLRQMRLHYLGRRELVLANFVPDLSGCQVANFVVWHAMSS